MAQFLKTMNMPDEAFLVDFADEAKVAQRFTSMPEELELKPAFLQPGGAHGAAGCGPRGLSEMKHRAESAQGPADYLRRRG